MEIDLPVIGRPFLTVLTIVGAFAMAFYYFALFLPRVTEAHVAMHLAGGYDFGHDFYPIWLTAHPGVNPYSPETTRQIQRGLFGRTLDQHTDPPGDYRTFAYPVFTNLLFWPATLLSFPAARLLMAVLLAGCTIASVFLWGDVIAWRPGALVLSAVALLTVCSYPVLEGLYADQIGLFVGLMLAGSIYALCHDRQFLAGSLLAVAMIKPQMAILAALYLVLWATGEWRERNDFLFSFLASGGVLVLAGLGVWPGWISSWIAAVLGYHHYADGPILAKILGIPEMLPIAIAAVIVALPLTWGRRKEKAGSAGFCLALSCALSLTSVTLLPSQGFQDQVILLPAIFLVWSRRQEFWGDRGRKILFGIMLALLFWPWLAAVAVIAVKPFFDSKAVFLLPVRTAAAFPFALLGVLALALRRNFAVAGDGPQ